MKSSRPIRILTPYDKRYHPAWVDKVTVLEPMAQEHIRHRGQPLSRLYRLGWQLFWTWRLFRLSRQYDAVLIGSDRVGLLFATLQTLFRRNPVPVIFIDFLINQSSRSTWYAKRFLYRLAVSGASRVIVQRRCEVINYAKALNVPADKFVFVRYHATVYDTPYKVSNAGYIFAGGDGHRDYSTLLRAMAGLPYPLTIAALEKKHFEGLQIPPNVRIVSANEAEYMALMAASAVVVVPLKKMPQHIGGEQTYENAMVMGKPVIVSDPDARDYITDGVNGIITPTGDAEALRSAITRLMENPELARNIGFKAKEAAAGMQPEVFFGEILRLCEEAVAASNDWSQDTTSVVPKQARERRALAPEDFSPSRNDIAPAHAGSPDHRIRQGRTLSIVIPTKNRPDDLGEAVQSILSQTVLPTQLIIVDQSATEESRQRVKATWDAASLSTHGPAVDLIYIHDTSITGAATARNRALELATSAVVLFLDDDVELEPAFIEEILTAYRKFPHASGISGIVTNYCPPPSLFRWWTRIFECGPFHDDRQPIYWNSRALVDHAPLQVTRFGGGLMSFRRSAIAGIMFDTNLAGASEGEDVDFCMHLPQGAVLLIAPRARLVHKQTSVSRSTKHWLYLHVRTNWYLYRRNWKHGIRNRLGLLWLTTGYFLTATLISLRQFSGTAWRSVFNGISDSHQLCRGAGAPKRVVSTQTASGSLE